MQTPPPPDELDCMDCPLCMEEIDPTDKHFKPCPCGYQVCRFCWNRIRQNGNERCPACRRVYTDDAVEFTPLSPEELAVLSSSKQKKSKKGDSMAPGSPATMASSTTRREFLDDEDGPVLPSRRHLVEVRVTQKNLVYVIGIPISMADEVTLRQEDFFGRFGKIVKLVINKRAYVRSTGNGAINNAAAYITYSKDEEALRAIKLVDGKMIDGAKLLRATYGTTKYCAHFLRGKTCPKPGCLYLHQEVFDDEVHNLVSSNASSAAPASSPVTPSVTLPPAVPKDELESEKAKSFFERLQMWTRMDQLMNDLSSPDTFGEEPVVAADQLTSFDPFEDALSENLKLDFVEDQQPAGSAKKEKISLHQLLASSSSNQQQTQAEEPKPPANYVDMVKTEKPTKKTPPKVFTTAQLAAKKKEPFVTATASASAQTVIPEPVTPQPVKHQFFEEKAAAAPNQMPSVKSSPVMVLKKAAPVVSNDNLFSVLSFDDSSVASSATDLSPQEASEEKPAPSNPSVPATSSTQKKKKKKDPQRQLEEDLDELLKQVESTKVVEEKPMVKPKAPAKANTAEPKTTTSGKPSNLQAAITSLASKPPFQSLLNALAKANDGKDKEKLERESSRRLTELEKVLAGAKVESKELEGALKESVVTFLESMNIPMDDDYLD